MDLVTATDLEQWAERRDAQAQLPQFVRRLIAATAHDLTRPNVRAGEGVALREWDGIAIALHPSTFVPSGLSAWEMGVGDPQVHMHSVLGRRAHVVNCLRYGRHRGT